MYFREKTARNWRVWFGIVTKAKEARRSVVVLGLLRRRRRRCTDPSLGVARYSRATPLPQDDIGLGRSTLVPANTRSLDFARDDRTHTPSPAGRRRYVCFALRLLLVVVLQAQVRDQFLAAQMPQRVLQLHQLDEEIVLGIQAGGGHGRLEVEA